MSDTSSDQWSVVPGRDGSPPFYHNPATGVSSWLHPITGNAPRAPQLMRRMSENDSLTDSDEDTKAASTAASPTTAGRKRPGPQQQQQQQQQPAAAAAAADPAIVACGSCSRRLRWPVGHEACRCPCGVVLRQQPAMVCDDSTAPGQVLFTRAISDDGADDADDADDNADKGKHDDQDAGADTSALSRMRRAATGEAMILSLRLAAEDIRREEISVSKIDVAKAAKDWRTSNPALWAREVAMAFRDAMQAFEGKPAVVSRFDAWKEEQRRRLAVEAAAAEAVAVEAVRVDAARASARRREAREREDEDMNALMDARVAAEAAADMEAVRAAVRADTARASARRRETRERKDEDMDDLMDARITAMGTVESRQAALDRARCAPLGMYEQPP